MREIVRDVLYPRGVYVVEDPEAAAVDVEFPRPVLARAHVLVDTFVDHLVTVIKLDHRELRNTFVFRRQRERGG